MSKRIADRSQTAAVLTPSVPQWNAIRVRGARTHNLKNVDLDVPHNQLTVITGVSGSGKSSLAFDTIFAEGQRQYIDTLSVYARQFIDQMQRPDVDVIEGLQPTLCIDQRSGSANPRSTVATVTEVYDYLRLMLAKLGTPHCFACGQAIIQQSPEQIQAALQALPAGTRLVVMAPVVRGRPGAHREVFAEIRKAGLIKVRVDGELFDIESVPELAVRKKHTIEAVVDRLILREGCEVRLAEALRLALSLTGGLVSVSLTAASAQKGEATAAQGHERLFSTQYACIACGVSYEELEPRTFSFNSPYGACPACEGMGSQVQFDPEALVVDWELSPAQGALAPLKTAPSSLKRGLRKSFESVLAALGGDWQQPLKNLKGAARKKLLLAEGGGEVASQPSLISELEKLLAAATARGHSEVIAWLETFRQSLPCAQCAGSRLRPEARSVTLGGRDVQQICALSIREALAWLEQYQPDAALTRIAEPIIQPMLHRLRFLDQVGLGYLTLQRSADSLSGGELQRVRLASSIGSGLVGVCYVLDEPSIGLHQRDNDRLIESLRNLQTQGNTVIVVEHDEAMMMAADLLVDVGPGAGSRGGQIVAAGTPQSAVQSHSRKSRKAAVADWQVSSTALYLSGQRRVQLDRPRRLPQAGHCLSLEGAIHHNLKNVSVEVPLGLLVGITGVSGSGKSSLISETLAPAVARGLGQAAGKPGAFRRLSGIEHVDKLIEITQDSIGRTPRSTPATYCGVFDLIRTVFAATPTAKQRGFAANRFSFNTGNGRCAQCQGQGQEKIEMNFLADLYVTCSVCGGSRFNRQTLQVRYRDKSIADVLAMSIDEATEFFANFSKIYRLLESLQRVGLGYLSLGQSSTTLSGGEAQRIKLATELARTETGRTIYFLDEPTTGLHFEDCQRLLSVLDGLVSAGNTVIVIEHNLDIIRACDWLIDLGPDGGSGGGEVLAVGSPEQLATQPQSITGRFLFPQTHAR